LAKAAELRERAARYRYLAGCTTDETSIEVLKTMSRECEEEAQRLEHEDAVEHAS
jgi:hypothetical protein